MSIKGSSYANFRRALLGGNMHIIEAAAAELQTIDHEDALRILVVMARGKDARFGRAAAKWAARVTAQRQLDVDASRRLLSLVELLPQAPEAIEPVLRKLCTGQE